MSHLTVISHEASYITYINLGINYESLSFCNDAIEHNEPKKCGIKWIDCK